MPERASGIKMVGMAEIEAPISLDGVAVHPDCWCVCLCYLHFAPENPEDGEIYLLVLSHPGYLRQSLASCKMVVCMCIICLMLFWCAGRTVIRHVQSVVQWLAVPRSPGCFLKSQMILRWLTRLPAMSWALSTVNQMIPILLMLNNLYIVTFVNIMCLLCHLCFNGHFE